MADPTNDLVPPHPHGLIPDPSLPQKEQILGVAANPDAARAAKWQRFYDQLVRQRDQLIDAVGQLTVDARETGPDPIQDGLAETGTELMQSQQSLGILELDNEVLADINLALSKMLDGSYGVCELTGQPIPEERLEALPWTRFSVEAQRARESQGEAPKAAVGPVSEMARSAPARTGTGQGSEGS